MSFKKTVPVFLVLLLGITKYSVAENGQTFKVGGIFDLTSQAGSQWGTAEKNGFLLAIDQFKGANPDIEVEPKIEESAYSNVKSVSAVQKLISVDKVNVVIGPTWETFVAVIPICENRKVICIAPSCHNASFDRADLEYSFSLWYDERDYSKVHASYINQHSYRKIALFAGISPYYDALVDSFVSLAKTKPVRIERTQPDERDFRSLIAKVPLDIDALVVFILGDGGSQNFFKQWAELRTDRPDVFTDDAPLYFDPPLDLSKSKMRIFYSSPDLSTADPAFGMLYRTKYGVIPEAPSGAVAYDATFLALNCMKNRSNQVDEVRNCIAATAGYRGMSGDLSFNGKQAVQERRMILRELKNN